MFLGYTWLWDKAANASINIWVSAHTLYLFARVGFMANMQILS